MSWPEDLKRVRLRLAACFFTSLVVAFLLLRLVLFFCFHPTKQLGMWPILEAFLIGFHLDLVVALLITLPVFGILSLLRARWFLPGWRRRLLQALFCFFWTGEIFLLVTEFYFFQEFRSRFNTVAVDYLLYPHEVFINIWDVYPVARVVAACAGLALLWLWGANRLFPSGAGAGRMRRGRLRPFAVAFAAAALLLPTIGFKEATFSGERFLNEVANNGAVSFVSAAVTRHLDFSAFYRTLSLPEAYRRTRALIKEPKGEFAEGGRTIRRHMPGDPSRPKLNVVILLEESLGSEFWGSLGRKSRTLTPEMDRLAAREGLLFTNIYASGNRTVRGMEGVLCSFPPLPGDSVVVRDLSDNVETIGRVLKRDGYQTLFMYGGRALFDGMRSFTEHNGYDRVIERKDFPNPTFTTVWGVCDEDLYSRAIEEFRAMAKTGRPFHATLLSVSNHKPFTYPKGRIPENPDERKRENAVKYADYALGRFFDAARQESFYTNTIFVVVADHGARVYGSQEIPIHSYEIPLLIAGPAVVKSPARIGCLGGQMDVAPTILGMIGRPYESMFYGRDLLHTSAEHAHVLLNHNRDIGMYRDRCLVVLGLNKTVQFYEGDPKQREMTLLQKPGPVQTETEIDTIALFETADDLYMHRRYRMDHPALVTEAKLADAAARKRP